MYPDGCEEVGRKQVGREGGRGGGWSGEEGRDGNRRRLLVSWLYRLHQRLHKSLTECIQMAAMMWGGNKWGPPADPIPTSMPGAPCAPRRGATRGGGDSLR